MMLPADIARCPGIRYDEGDWLDDCEECQRRTAPIPEDARRVAWIQPPAVIAFECEMRIEP